MLALPLARLVAPLTLFSTCFLAFAVRTLVLAFFTTRGAVPRTVHFAFVAAEKETVAF